MKRLFLIILTLTTLKVAGQNHLIGVRGGVNATNVTSSNFISQRDSRIGLTAGLTYEFLLKKHFTIGADFIYNQRGFKIESVHTDQIGNPTGEKSTAKLNYDYISLPIKAGFNIGSKLYGFANLGLVPSWLVDAKTIIPTFDSDANFIGNETIDPTNLVSKFDLAGLFEIGGGYKINGRYWVFTSFSYQHSFTSIANSEYFAESKILHNGMNFSIGLKYALTKE